MLFFFIIVASFKKSFFKQAINMCEFLILFQKAANNNDSYEKRIKVKRIVNPKEIVCAIA